MPRKKRPITECLSRLVEMPLNEAGEIDYQPQTPAEAIALNILRMSMGWTEDGIRMKPTKAAIDISLERLEGRVKPTEQISNAPQTHTERVRALSRSRLNDMADEAAGAVSESAEDLDGPDYEAEDS